MNNKEQTRWLPYRILRKYAIANISLFFSLRTDAMGRIDIPHGIEIRQCSSENLRDATRDSDHQFAESDFSMLDSGKSSCFAAFEGQTLVGFAWVGYGIIDCEMNHDGKPETGLPIQLAKDAVYVYQVFVFPNYRGRRIYAALLSEMADTLGKNGIQTFVLATEASNWSALRAVRRMGFKKLGTTWLLKVGSICKARYPELAADCGFQIGRYVGDQKKAV
jgi:ribosomal protein S18 acetylase RimI-like enzyme